MTDLATPASTRTWEGVDIPVAGTYALDPSHTSVGFVARHLMVTKVRGAFTEFEGTVTIADDPLASSVEVSIAAASFRTGDDGRDGHVRSADLLDVETHPTLTFRSTGVRHTKHDRFEVTGDLTIRDVTRSVVLDMTLDGVVGDPWGGTRLAFTAETEIDREDFGITWNVALESGGVLVGKKVKIELEGQAVRQ